MPAAISCDALTRDFGAVRALDGLTLAVPAGSIFAFLGPNGAGKTTTIHLLLGIIEPTSGSSRTLGLDPVADGDRVRRNSGALLEHSGLYERLSAEENLRYYARIAHFGRDEADARIEELLTRFGLWERRADAVGTWSRGMKQKLAIARVLLHRPSLVFLDEPTAGLDPEATVALRRDITSLETTVFLTTHNLTDVEKMATHVAVIQSGKLLDFGTPAELRARAVRSQVTISMTDREPVTLDLPPGESVAPFVTRLVHEGARIEEVRRDEPSLEDVFLHLVKHGGQAIVPVQPVEHGQAGLPVLHQKREPLFRDVGTVMLKEWIEMTSAAGATANRKVTAATAALLLAIVGGVAAFLGEKLVQTPAALLVGWVSFIILMASVADSFAGERERHTLETLLASAVPDEALLLGKILASVVYGWGAALVLLTVMLLGANVTSFGAMYPPSVLLGVLVLVPLALFLFSTAGVFLSLRAATVKIAQARLAVLLFSFLIPIAPLRLVMTDAWKRQAFERLSTESGRLQAIATQSLVLAVLDVALLALAMTRFRRSRLI